MSRTTVAPSPTADATRLIEPYRTSPAANTPGMLVSSIMRSRCLRLRSGVLEKITTCDHVALRVAHDLIGEPLGVRLAADHDEQRGGGDLFDGAVGVIGERDGFERSVPPPSTTSVRWRTTTFGSRLDGAHEIARHRLREAVAPNEQA